MKINFNLRDASGKSDTPINVVIRYNSLKLVVSSGETIDPKFWSKTKQRAKVDKRFPEHPEFNHRLTVIEAMVNNAFRKFLNNKEREPTVKEFREALNTDFKKEKPVEVTLFQFIEKFIGEAPSRASEKTGKPIAKSTIQVYKNTLCLLNDFSKSKRKKIDFEDIDLDFYFEFRSFLASEKEHSENTIGKYIKTLKTFLNDATERGINKHLAFKSKRFKITQEQTDTIYLNKKEIEALFELNLSKNQRLDRVRDLFIVGCWTGLRFSDLSTLEPHHFNEQRIKIRTQKTDQLISVPLHPFVLKIREKYKDLTNNGLPPAISNVKMNAYLKELGQMIPSLNSSFEVSFTKGAERQTVIKNKWELLTTHTARRSFATNNFLDGVPAYSIMQITGHKTESSFLKYIKVGSEEHAKIMSDNWNKIKL